jgi:acetyltransferase-like isoleucine patch superfamily enzyme
LPSLKEFEFGDTPKDLISVINKPVILETHTEIGAHTVILPGGIIGKNSAISSQLMFYESIN